MLVHCALVPLPLFGLEHPIILFFPSPSNSLQSFYLPYSSQEENLKASCFLQLKPESIILRKLRFISLQLIKRGEIGQVSLLVLVI